MGRGPVAACRARERHPAAPAGQNEQLRLQIPISRKSPGGELFFSEAPLVFAPSDAALVALHEVAQAIVQQSGCREVEAVAWLLADEPPSWPLLSLYSQVCRYRDSPPYERRYTITVGCGLVPPEEVARFYREQRDRDAWAGLPQVDFARQPRAFTAELLAFVAEQRPGVAAELVRNWPQLHRLWAQRYPQKPYRSWRAMRETYLRVMQRARCEQGQGSVEARVS